MKGLERHSSQYTYDTPTQTGVKQMQIMNQTKLLNKVEQLHNNAKDGTLKLKGTTYSFVFDRLQGIYRVIDLNTSEEITRLNTRKIADAKKWLKEYLAN